MKRILIVISMAIFALASAAAQPRALGARIGSSFEASYQHEVAWGSFIEADLGIDYIGSPGMRVSASWNFILAEPMWSRGDWAFYLGPSVTMGYMNDVIYRNREHNFKAFDMGFTAGGGFQFGLEYTFWFPLQLSVDLRPVFGVHVADVGTTKEIVNGEVVSTKHEIYTNFYDYGMFGFIPTLAVRYRF